MRSASNEFHGGLFKNSKFKNKKKLFCAFVCVSLGLKKPGDFTMSKGHGYPLVILNKFVVMIETLEHVQTLRVLF